MLKILKLKLFALLGLALGGGKLMAIETGLMQQMGYAVESICAKVRELEEENKKLDEQCSVAHQFVSRYKDEVETLVASICLLQRQNTDLESKVAEYKKQYDDAVGQNAELRNCLEQAKRIYNQGISDMQSMALQGKAELEKLQAQLQQQVAKNDLLGRENLGLSEELSVKTNHCETKEVVIQLQLEKIRALEDKVEKLQLSS